MDEDDPKEYRWETGYEKTWEAIKEDDDGFLEASISDIIQRAKRKRQALKQGHTKLGMMRHLYIIIDCSDSMSSQDLKPTRLLCTLKLLEIFIEEFFDQNPISQLGIIIMHNKRSEKISELAGNPKKHLKALHTLSRTTLVGEPSLQNGLEMALKSLKLLPSHASREILVLMGSLTTCDPSNINVTIENLKNEGVRCCVIGLAAEVHICRQIANETGGQYNVILDDSHYKDLLFQNVDPPPAAVCLESSLIKMGFPHQMSVEGTEEPLTMCMCHIDCPDESSKLTTGGYYCPQCYSKYCELPVECRACGLTLVSAPHLARSYHHLFPAANYKEIPYDNQVAICFACQKTFTETEKQVYNCPNCTKIFCIDCDIFIHDTLHTCPGCATNLATFQIAHDDENDCFVHNEPDSSIGYSEDQHPFDAKSEADGAERLPISWYRQIFNLNHVGVPTRLSENIVALAVTVYCILCCALSLCLIFLNAEISNGTPYAITIPSIIFVLMLIVLLSIYLQPKSDRLVTFKVPWVPLIPAVSILINIYLMFSLDVETWIRLGVWMAIGLPIYFYSALCRKQKAPNNVLAVIINENGDAKHNNLDEGYQVVDEKPHNGITLQHDWNKRLNAFHSTRKENVVAIVHREDVPIIEEEENEDESNEQNNKKNIEILIDPKIEKLNSVEEEETATKSLNTSDLYNKQISISTEINEVVEEVERVVENEEDKDRSGEVIAELEEILENEEHKDKTNEAIKELENVIEDEENKYKTNRAIEELENVIEGEENKDKTNKAIEELENVIENEEHKEVIEELETVIKNEEELNRTDGESEENNFAKENEEIGDNKDKSVIKNEDEENPTSSNEDNKDNNNNTYFIPPPPPIADFEKLVTIPTIPRFPRLSFQNKYKKKKPYIPPTDYAAEEPKEDELPDTIKLGSSDHDKLKNKLSAILVNKVPTKLTKPPVNTEEIADDMPLRKNSLKPLMTRIISAIPLKSEQESGESDEDVELSMEEIKEKLNNLFQTTKAKSPVDAVKQQEVQRKNSLTFPRRTDVKVGDDSEDYEHHKKLMQMTFSKIKLRRNSLQLFANT